MTPTEIKAFMIRWIEWTNPHCTNPELTLDYILKLERKIIELEKELEKLKITQCTETT